MKADFDPRKFAEEALRNAREANPPEPLPPLSWIDTSSWDQGPDPEREWFIRDRIPIRQPTLLSGEGAVLCSARQAASHRVRNACRSCWLPPSA